MRTIQVSLDVFAKIWALRAHGEDSEDAILRRILLGVAPTFNDKRRKAESGGFVASRFGVRFPEGFEIFRNFKGRDFRARASGGRWQLIGDPRSFKSLSDLSKAVGAQIENVWMNWFFLDGANVRRPISILRDPKLISKRHA